MKTTMNIVLDIEVKEMLKKAELKEGEMDLKMSASALINKLLLEYFENLQPKTRAERERELEILKIKIEAGEKLEALNGKPITA